jgi:hypothetical protein
MIQIVLHRSLSGIIACLDVRQWEGRDTSHGRQGKSAAFGRAHVVGWISCFRHLATNQRWRFFHFLKQFQLSRRHRGISRRPSR